MTSIGEPGIPVRVKKPVPMPVITMPVPVKEPVSVPVPVR